MDFTIDECKIWIQDPLRNPRTNRSIKANAITYNKLKTAAAAFGLIAPVNHATVCSTRWIKLENMEAMEYNKAPVVSCTHCHYFPIVLRAIHDEYGDYQCVRCTLPVNLAYFCAKCKGMTEEDE
jgi:hypothetical protein